MVFKTCLVTSVSTPSLKWLLHRAINQDASCPNVRWITTPESSDVMMMTHGTSELTFPVSLVPPRADCCYCRGQRSVRKATNYLAARRVHCTFNPPSIDIVNVLLWQWPCSDLRAQCPINTAILCAALLPCQCICYVKTPIHQCVRVKLCHLCKPVYLWRLSSRFAFTSSPSFIFTGKFCKDFSNINRYRRVRR